MNVRLISFQKRYEAVGLFLAALISGCSLSTPAVPPLPTFSPNGSITLTRLAPLPRSVEGVPVLGFLPSQATRAGRWIAVNLSQKTLTLMDGEKALVSCPTEGAVGLAPGVYTVQLKQRSPLWYAGDGYFSNRGLPVPLSGDASRYLRGALGDFAIFIDQNTAIHSSPLWTPEVGGMTVSDAELQKIYYSVDVGSQIEIK